MRRKKLTSGNPWFTLVPSILLLCVSAVGAKAQSAPSVAAQNPGNGQQSAGNTQAKPANNQPISGNIQPAPATPSGPTGEEIQKRVDRARALAAAHQLEGAARELESARAATRDVGLRDGTSVMLMGIYLEAGNYSRAQSLLEESFVARSTAKDGSIRSYFALAGQAVNGVRLHLARYRSFAVSIGSATLPPEAVSDLDRLRALLERMVAQAKEITDAAPRTTDGLALLEDVLGIRASVPRDSEDREKWQEAYSQAREELGSGRVEVASIRGVAGRAQPAHAVEKGTTRPVQEQTIDAGSLNDRASRRVVPIYPAIAKTAKADGVVKVHVIVNESGEVQVTNSEGPMLLRQAAEEAARGWRFSPAVVEGKPARLIGFIEFNFAL